MDPDIQNCLATYPFLTYGTAHGVDYIGIIIINGKNYTCMYALNNINDAKLRKRLIELGEKWWWQSNRNIPISLFMSEEMAEFDFCKQRLATKDYQQIAGPTVSLSRLPTKRIKRCTTILKKPKS